MELDFHVLDNAVHSCFYLKTNAEFISRHLKSKNRDVLGPIEISIVEMNAFNPHMHIHLDFFFYLDWSG